MTKLSTLRKKIVSIKKLVERGTKLTALFHVQIHNKTLSQFTPHVVETRPVLCTKRTALLEEAIVCSLGQRASGGCYTIRAGR